VLQRGKVVEREELTADSVYIAQPGTSWAGCTLNSNTWGKKMSKNLFWLALAVAFIGGVAGDALTGQVGALASFILIGAGVYIGWTCVPESRAKDYAIGAAALVFLNAPGWGNAGAVLGEITWIGGYISAIFSALVNLVIAVAAVGMLKSLVDGAKAQAGAGM